MIEVNIRGNNTKSRCSDCKIHALNNNPKRRYNLEEIKKSANDSDNSFKIGKCCFLNICKSCNFFCKGWYCKRCKVWNQYRSLFKKLNIDDSNLQHASLESLKILTHEYFVLNHSKPIIMKKYGLMSNTIFNFFKKHGIELRTLSQSQQNNIFMYGLSDRNISGKYQYKTGYHIDWQGSRHYYRSSYELDYYLILDNNKINYTTEKLRFKYFDNTKQKERIAIPDIYNIDENTIIEVKSKYTYDYQEMKDKVQVYKENGYNFKLILDYQTYDYLPCEQATIARIC